jgi:hypothetical protein
MRIAHLILTHKNVGQLERLIRRLDHPCFDLFIHLDRKSDIQPFLHLADRPNVFFVRDRVPVYWAGYGTIQATLNGFKEILVKGEYDYINVMSAQDFPLRSAEYIYHYLSRNAGREFITCESIEEDWPSAAGRIRQYHLINWRIPGKFKLERILNRVLPARTFPLDYTVVGRSNWFTLTVNAVRYMVDFLKAHPRVVTYFKYCWGADEFIFSTVLYNSPYKEKITDNLMYVDWEGQSNGHPRILLTRDLPALQATPKLMARKFDIQTDPGIFSLLEQWIASGAADKVEVPQ